MSVSTSVWKRVGHALRTNLSANGGDHSAITIQPIATKSTARPNGENGNGSSWHLPWQWGRGRMSKAEQRYQRVAELLTALREQFERQDRRAEQLARGVENIGVTLQQLAKTQQSQSASVGKIAERVDEAGKYTAGMSSMLLEMPASLQSQAEAIRAVAKELESTRAVDGKLVDSLQQFSLAADSLRDAGQSQTDTLERLHTSGVEERESLQRFIRQQSQRMLIATIAIGVLAIGTLVGLGAVIWTMLA